MVVVSTLMKLNQSSSFLFELGTWTCSVEDSSDFSMGRTGSGSVAALELGFEVVCVVGLGVGQLHGHREAGTAGHGDADEACNYEGVS